MQMDKEIEMPLPAVAQSRQGAVSHRAAFGVSTGPRPHPAN